MYINFDDIPDSTLAKEREACFTSGSNGEKLAQYITDNRTKHAENTNALRRTIELFGTDEPKRRLHGKVTARLEQERKWVKHYDTCANEHKKGTIVAKLKAELEATKKAALKKEQTMREAHEAKLEEVRKLTRTQARNELEAELKAKKKVKKATKKPWYQWWLDIWNWEPRKKNDTVTPAKAAVMQEAVPDTSKMSKKERRTFYLARAAERANNKA